MVEEGLLQPQTDVVAGGGVLLGRGGFPLGEGAGLTGGGAGIEEQPGHGEAHRPIPGIGGGEGQGGGAATAAAPQFKVAEAGKVAAAAGVSKQRQLGQQARCGGLLLLRQGLARGQDRFELGVAAVGRQQARLEIQRPARQHHDRIAGAGGDLGRQVEQHRQPPARHGAISHGLNQRFFIGGLDRAAPQHIEARHQAGLLEIEAVLQDHQIVAHVRVVDAHQLPLLLQLVVGLAHLQLQGAQLIGVGVALLLEAGAGCLHLGGAGEIEQRVVELQPAFKGAAAGGGLH